MQRVIRGAGREWWVGGNISISSGKAFCDNPKEGGGKKKQFIPCVIKSSSITYSSSSSHNHHHLHKSSISYWTGGGFPSPLYLVRRYNRSHFPIFGSNGRSICVHNSIITLLLAEKAYKVQYRQGQGEMTTAD